MYSGTTLTSYSGRVMGAHQKIDRAARRCLTLALPEAQFPSIHRILHFEGGNGPDAIKRKSPAHDEPWHFIQPFDETDTLLLDAINDHYERLVQALKAADMVRAAFEAAWLAHAMVDGLTPAHHFPYEEELAELRGSSEPVVRATLKEKMMLPGDSLRETAKNNWGFWGPKGLFTTHFAFEWGFATLILPMRLRKRIEISETEAQHIAEHGIAPWFRRKAQGVAKLELYDSFYKHGWTGKLAKDIRRELAPTIVKAVATAWSSAALEAAKGKK